MKTKILLTAIFKDDSEFEMADRMLESFMPYCAGLAVALTGMSGEFIKLKGLIKKYKGTYIETSPKTHPKIYNNGKFANFAEARNTVFELADRLKGYDWYTWADTDDILVSGEQLQDVADKAKKFDMDVVFFTYWYAIRIKPDNTFSDQDVQIDHTRERLLKPHMFKWISRLHEVAVPKDGNYKPKVTEYNYDPEQNQLIVWAHITGNKRVEGNMQRNIDILKLQLEDEKGKDPRTLFYLAKTYYDLKQDDKDIEALDLLAQYRVLSGWAEERANSWEYTANILSRQNKHKEAVEALFEGSKEFPNRHMFYLLLAKEYGILELWEQSDFWLDTATKMDAPQTRTTIGNPLEIKYLAASLKYNEAIRKQQLDDAISWAKVRNKIGGHEDDGMIKTLEEAKLLNQQAITVFNFAKWLKDNGHVSKIPALLESLPNDLGREAFAHYIANMIAEPKIWGSKTIVYFASWGTEHFEGWSPKSLESGIGGSETAVIELAKRWKALGYDVWVYGDPRDDAGDYEGVHYRPWYELNWSDTFNTLILWRSPHLLDREIKAKKIFMDLHDVASQLDWNEDRIKKVDKIFVKSQFHRSMLPKVPDEKIAVISNGIQL